MISRLLSVLFVGVFCLAAQAELVFDPIENKSADREQLRKEAVVTSLTGQNSVPAVQQNQIVGQPTEVQTIAPANSVVSTTTVAPAPTVVAPVPVAAPAASPAPSFQLQVNQLGNEPSTQAEILRRKRIQEEVRNEDKIQTRVEELRLRDESKRTNKILETVPVEEPVVAASVQQTQTVSVAANPAPTTVAPAPSSTVTAVPGQYDQLPTYQSAPSYEGEKPVAAAALFQEIKQDQTVFALTPKGTVSNFLSVEPYDIDAQFGFGVDAGLRLTRNFSIVFGYAYTRFGAGISNYVDPYAGSGFYGYQGSGPNDLIKISHNMFELALKIQFFDLSTIVRPFILGGFGVSMSYINYNKNVLNYWGSNGANGLGPDYKLMQYTGVLGGGLDIKLASSVFLTGAFKWYPVIASNEESGYSNQYYYQDPYFNGFGSNPYSYIYNQGDKQGVANAIKDSSLISGTLGLLITF